MKKIVAMLMAIMMLVLPMAGLAEGIFGVDPFTQAIENGRRVTTNVYVENIAADFTGEEAIDQIIVDLLSALNITTYTQDNEEYFALGMKQQNGEVADLLTFGFAQKDDVTTLSSNLLGGAIAVGKDEAQPVVERLIDTLVLIGLFTEDDAQMIKEEMGAMIASMPDQTAMEAELEAMIAKIDFMALDFSALTDAFLPVLESMQMGEVTMQPKNCDPAVNVVTLNITGEQMKAMLTSFFRFIKANPQLAEVSGYFYDMVLSSVAVMAEGEEIPTYNEMLDKMLAEMDEEINIEGDTTVTVYLGEDGMPVMAEVKFPEQNASDEEAVAETVSHTYVPTITYTRLTMNEVAAHSIVVDVDNVDMTINLVAKDETVTVNFAVAEDGATLFLMNIDCLNRSAENLIAFDMLIDFTIVDNEQYDYEYNEATGNYETIKLDPVTIEFGMKITSDTDLDALTSKNTFTINAAGKDYLTIVTDTAVVDAGASIADGDVLRLAALEDADFANWFVGVINGLQTWLYSAIEVLPASVLNLIMSM